MTEALLATTPTVPIGVGAHIFHLVPIPGGTFDMGDKAGDLWEACRPVHPVRLDDFCLGQFPVTQALWRTVVESMPGDLDPDPSFFKRRQPAGGTGVVGGRAGISRKTERLVARPGLSAADGGGMGVRGAGGNPTPTLPRREGSCRIR